MTRLQSLFAEAAHSYESARRLVAAGNADKRYAAKLDLLDAKKVLALAVQQIERIEQVTGRESLPNRRRHDALQESIDELYAAVRSERTPAHYYPPSSF